VIGVHTKQTDGDMWPPRDSSRIPLTIAYTPQYSEGDQWHQLDRIRMPHLPRYGEPITYVDHLQQEFVVIRRRGRQYIDIHSRSLSSVMLPASSSATAANATKKMTPNGQWNSRLWTVPHDLFTGIADGNVMVCRSSSAHEIHWFGRNGKQNGPWHVRWNAKDLTFTVLPPLPNHLVPSFVLAVDSHALGRYDDHDTHMRTKMIQPCNEKDETKRAIPTTHQSSSSMDMNDNKRYLVVVSSSCVHLYDSVTTKWSSLSESHDIGRSWKGAVPLLARNRILIFGGEYAGSNTIDCFDLVKLSWSTLQWRLPVPPSRAPLMAFHVYYINGIVYFVGGMEQCGTDERQLGEAVPSKRCWSLDIHNLKSTWIPIASLPESRINPLSFTCSW
jgi:hypothetical protein